LDLNVDFEFLLVGVGKKTRFVRSVLDQLAEVLDARWQTRAFNGRFIVVIGGVLDSDLE
jgi:hypothetical protein